MERSSSAALYLHLGALAMDNRMAACIGNYLAVYIRRIAHSPYAAHKKSLDLRGIRRRKRLIKNVRIVFGESC